MAWDSAWFSAVFHALSARSNSPLISPDCADAYVLLAEQAKSRKESLQLYEQAVAAGERAIGPDAFTGDVGHFWGLLETRPYMRAREGLAHTLWTLGRREEAAGHLLEMLRLNPGDNQGVRYTLASWLRHWGQRAPMARELSVHPQTVGYRVGRLRELFGDVLEDPDARFDLELALRGRAVVTGGAWGGRR